MPTKRKKPTYTLVDWTIDMSQEFPKLIGISPDHPSEYLRNRLFRSSRLISVDFSKRKAETQHTIYKLR